MANEDDDADDLSMYASYGGGGVDDPQAIARGRARIDALVQEGIDSGPPVPFDMRDFLAEERRSDA